MNWPAVRTVFYKEMREFLRDRRAIMVGVILPILLYPVLTIFMTLMVGSQITKLTSETYEIGVSPPSRLDEVKDWYQQQQAARQAAVMKLLPPPAAQVPPSAHPPAHSPARPPAEGGLPPTAGENSAQPGDPSAGAAPAAEASPMAAFQSSASLTFVPVEPAEAENRLKQKEVKAIILFQPAGQAQRHGLPPPDNRKVDADEPDITILKESADIRSNTAARYCYNLLSYHRDQLIRAKLTALGGDPDKLLEPFQIDTSQDISTKEEKGGALFGGMLPFMLVVMLISAASYPAIDVTTGERERGTMETLLIAPVHARDLVAGKFLAVFAMACSACLFNVLSLGFSMYFGGMSIASQLDLQVPWTALPWVLLLLLPLAILFSALLMLAGSFAASTKEAQTYLSPVIMLAMFPSMLAMVPGIELKGGWLFLPIGNVTLLSRDLMSGQVKFPEGLQTIALVLGSTWLYAASVVGLAGSLFGREEVLYGEKPWRVLLDRKRMKPRLTPSAWEALLIAACALPFSIYASMLFDGLLANQTGHLWPNVPAQLLGLLIWPLLYAWRSKSNLSATFALQAPQPTVRLLSLPFLMVGGYLLAHLVAMVTEWLLPPDHMAEMLSKVIEQEMSHRSLLAMIVIIAVTPAICEELLFRGFLQQSLLKHWKPGMAITVQAIAFAIFHTSLNRLPYTFALGLVIGYLAWRTRSVVPGMLLHFFVNAAEVLLGYLHKWAQDAGTASPLVDLLTQAYDKSHLAITAVVTAALLIVGILLLRLGQMQSTAADAAPTPNQP